mgnify:CR=1 FL=1
MDLKFKNILVWTGSFYPKIGGLEIASLEYAKYLKEKGHYVSVITNKYPLNLNSKEYINGIKIRRFRFFHSPFNYLRKLRLDIFIYWIFMKIFTLVQLIFYFFKEKPKIVNLHFPDHQLFEILILKFFFKFDLIINLHGSEITQVKYLKRTNLKYFFYQLVFKKSMLIVACSKSLLDMAFRLFPELDYDKCTVVYNGVNNSFFFNKINVLKSDYIFSAMRFVPKKGLDLMIKSINSLKLKNKIIIAGGDKKDAKKLLGDLKTDLSISFIGKLKPKSILKHLKDTRLTIIPSREEPFGIFLAEALCSGSPVVVTNVGGIPEVISLAKRNLSKKQKQTFDSFVKVVTPNTRLISKSVELLLENDKGNDDYIKIIPLIRKNFKWEIILDNFYKLIRVNI